MNQKSLESLDDRVAFFCSTFLVLYELLSSICVHSSTYMAKLD